jgi:hypothetical protein
MGVLLSKTSSRLVGHGTLWSEERSVEFAQSVESVIALVLLLAASIPFLRRREETICQIREESGIGFLVEFRDSVYAQELRAADTAVTALKPLTGAVRIHRSGVRRAHRCHSQSLSARFGGRKPDC